MRAEAYIYVEDGDLVVGIRSNNRFKDSFEDDGHFVSYHNIDGMDSEIVEIETLTIVPKSDGWEVYFDEEQYEYIPFDGSYSAQFEFII